MQQIALLWILIDLVCCTTRRLTPYRYEEAELWNLSPAGSQLLNEKKVSYCFPRTKIKIKNKIHNTKWKSNSTLAGGKGGEKPSRLFSEVLSPIFALNNVINLCIIIFILHFPIWLIFRWNHCHIKALDRITVSLLQ